MGDDDFSLVGAVFKFHIGHEALVALDQAATEEGVGKLHRRNVGIEGEGINGGWFLL